MVKSTIEFKAPAKVDEIIELYVRVAKIGNTSLTLNMEIYPEGSDRLLTNIETIYVGYEAATESSKQVPKDIRKLINTFEETGEILPVDQLPDLARAIAFNKNHLNR